MSIFNDPAKRAAWVHGQPMKACPKCGAYDMAPEIPIVIEVAGDETPALPPYIYGRECSENERVIPIGDVERWGAEIVRQAVAAERKRLLPLTLCGCGDQFTAHDPGTCGNCVAALTCKPRA